MAMKRKRSAQSLFTTTSIEAATTPFSISPTRLPDFFLQSKILEPHTITLKPAYPDAQLQNQDSIPQTNSRTRKRYRDNRPQEAEIHASTVQKLFSAQKSHPDAEPLPSQSQPQYPQHTAQKSTLHSFWQLPQTAQQHGGLYAMQQEEMLKCEDCDRGLLEQDGMDLDGRCAGCARCVCDTCTIMAESRLCLECAMQT